MLTQSITTMCKWLALLVLVSLICDTNTGIETPYHSNTTNPCGWNCDANTCCGIFLVHVLWWTNSVRDKAPALRRR
jgi:hypothetical protein